ncbi:hypothetical protein [Fodinibius sp.]|uniref:hypothetical protein n=1 Tax=Fodinibius sp. TaxID=1872440 RepID=UPI002ACEFAFF|nr:hypothetical protein [Fodinibius sp.]MDZ7660305.1 hypothetical protein [Fodinibius sp.]
MEIAQTKDPVMVSDQQGARPSPNGVSAFNIDWGSPRSQNRSLAMTDLEGGTLSL